MSSISIIKVVLCCFLIIVSGCTPASSSNSLAESDHPYANNYENAWTISEPGATQIRIHFESLQLATDDAATIGGYDKVILLDKFDNELGEYGDYNGINSKGFWTEWYTGDTLKVKLVTDSSRTDYGFNIDKVETRPDSMSNNSSAKSNSLAESTPVAESDHPYANNFENTWKINEPGATRIRLHFEYIQLASDDDLMFEGYDKVILLDKGGHELKTYGDYDGVNYQDFWTDWYTEDTLNVKLVTDGSRTDYGFKIDKIEASNNGSSEAQSNGVESSGTESSNILTDTALSSSTNPSTFGQSVTLVAKVDTPSKETEEPFGTVTFMDETTPIGTVDLISGQATLNTSSLSVGSHSITAEYSGDSNFKFSKSSPLTLTVQEQPSSEERASKENSNTEPSTTNKEPIWENPIISGTIATVIGGVILASIKKKPPKDENGQS